MNQSRSSRRRARLGLVLVLGGLGLLVTYAVANYAGKLVDRHTATGSGYGRLWLDTPDVGPGDTIHLRVGTRGGLKSKIDRIIVEVGNRRHELTGKNVGWGFSISSRSSNEDQLGVDVPAPADARVGDVVPIEVTIELTVARRTGRGQFENDTSTAFLTTQVTIRSPGALAWQRGLSGGGAALALLVACGGPFLVGRRRRVPAATSSGGTGGANFVLLAIVVAMLAAAALGQLVFARPLMRAIGSFGGFLATLLLVVWLVAPVAAFAFGRWRAPLLTRILLRAVMGRVGTPHRPPAAVGPADTSRAAEPRTFEAIAAALQSEGLVIKRRRRVARIVVDGRPSVWLTVDDAARVTPESLTVEAVSMRAALRPIAALVGVFGALEIRTLGGAPRIIEQATDVDVHGADRRSP